MGLLCIYGHVGGMGGMGFGLPTLGPRLAALGLVMFLVWPNIDQTMGFGDCNCVFACMWLWLWDFRLCLASTSMVGTMAWTGPHHTAHLHAIHRRFCRFCPGSVSRDRPCVDPEVNAKDHGHLGHGCELFMNGELPVGWLDSRFVRLHGSIVIMVHLLTTGRTVHII